MKKVMGFLVCCMLVSASFAETAAQDLRVFGKIAYSNNPGSNLQVYVSNPDRSNTVQITRGLYQEATSPAWSPEGSTIALITGDNNGDPRSIFFVSPDGVTRNRITNTNNNCPQWSPDGAILAFLSGGNIYFINTDGTGLNQLTSTEDYEYISWSPDGTKIIFSSARGFSSPTRTALTQLWSRIPEGLPEHQPGLRTENTCCFRSWTGLSQTQSLTASITSISSK